MGETTNPCGTGYESQETFVGVGIELNAINIVTGRAVRMPFMIIGTSGYSLAMSPCQEMCLPSTCEAWVPYPGLHKQPCMPVTPALRIETVMRKAGPS